MTVLAGIFAGLFALRDGVFRPIPWLLLILGLALSHAANNLFNDYTDFARGVDKDNYFRTLYGPQPVAHGLMTPRTLLTYSVVTGVIAAALGVLLFALDGWDLTVLVFLAAGAAFVLLYTWPLKYIAMGELSVLAVWGPLMIGGGYYALTRTWDWNVVWGSAPYALIVTTVIFGKHIDKMALDRKKGIRTLPVLIGEAASRYAVIAMLILPYAIIAVLIVLRYFTPALAVVLAAVPATARTFSAFLKPRPARRPADFPKGQGGWPLYFAPIAFVYTRSFGTWFLLGMAAEAALRLIFPGFWR
jgi:1,4-dihydroxy-2-naphthoate octaprenyltransferase